MARKKPNHPLFQNGAGKVSGVAYGVLRARYNGVANSVSSYVAGKLAVPDPTAKEWNIGRRYDIVMPRNSPDIWWAPAALWRAYDAACVPQQRDLAIALTCYGDDGLPVHQSWEQVRAWARAALVEERQLAVTLILHLPSAAGSANTPHVHLIASARQALGWGFGGFAKETNDEGVRQLADCFADHRKAWVRGERP